MLEALEGLQHHLRLYINYNLLLSIGTTVPPLIGSLTCYK